MDRRQLAKPLRASLAGEDDSIKLGDRKTANSGPAGTTRASAREQRPTWLQDGRLSGSKANSTARHTARYQWRLQRLIDNIDSPR